MDSGLIITQTDWGLQLALPKGIVIDDHHIVNAVQEISRLLRENGHHRVLVELESIDRRLSTFGILDGLDRLGRLSPELRMAVVSPGYVGDEDSRVVENASPRRSLHIRFFACRKDAVEWLSQPVEPVRREVDLYV